MTYSDDDKAVLLLTTRLTDPEHPSLSPEEWWAVTRVLAETDASVSDILSGSIDSALPPGLRPRVEHLRRTGVGLGIALESLASRGLMAITHVSEKFPNRLRSRLGDQCPPALVVAGDPAVLDRGGLGIVGSRDVSPRGAEIAAQAATLAAKSGVQVVSGAAGGVDQLAMLASSESGGITVGFVADSLTKQVRDSSVRRLIREGHLALASMQHPDAGFSVDAAMGRNKLIYAAADATLVVAAASGTGGTWAGATEALARQTSPVFVWSGEGQGSGNQDLINLGATPVTDMETLFSEWPPGPRPIEQDPTQTALF